MYDINLEKNEKILLISDNTIINNKECSCIITNERLLILAYPESYHNSREELRILNRINYIKMKEIIFETKLKNIKEINKDKIIFSDDTNINIKDTDVITKLKQINN